MGQSPFKGQVVVHDVVKTMDRVEIAKLAIKSREKWSAKNGVEYLFYRGVGWNVETGLEDEKVYVRFKDGLVDSYGPSTELDKANNINLKVTN